MKRVLRIDLHTHLYEATGCDDPDRSLLDEVLDRARGKLLDGLGVTEHWDWEFGRRLVRLKEEIYPGDEFLLIPGREIEAGRDHFVEILLPGDRLFRFLAHPAYGGAFSASGNGLLTDVCGIEVANSMHTVIEERARQIALENDLIVLRNSDAHYLGDIGTYSSELVWDPEEDRWWGYGVDGRLLAI